jgi:molybdenum cofactor guanylyltransferase
MGTPPFRSKLSLNSGADANTPVGVVLAGGLSRRMGRDKAKLLLGGSTLAERAAAKLAAVCPEVVVADRGRGTVPGLPSVDDEPAAAGPAAALLGAARERPGRPLLALACDLPGIPVALLARIADLGANDGVFPRRGERLEPLCALYGPAALAALAERVRRGSHALHPLAAEPGLALRFLDEQELRRFGDPDALFENLNTPEDLARWNEG